MRRHRVNKNRGPLALWHCAIIAGLILLGLIILRGFLRVGFPQTHDGDMHLARLANLNLAFHDYHLPFRWARNLNHEFGLPIFNFYYYLLELIAFIPMKLGLTIENSLKLVTTGAFIGTGLTWYWWLKDKYGRFSAASAGIFSLTAIYPLSLIMIRGSLGEVLAYFLLTLNFYLLDRLIKHPGRLNYLLAVGGVSAFLLSHNISVIFGLPLLFLKYRRAGWVFINSIGLSLFFWLPLIFERQFTYFSSIQSQAELFQHFPAWWQLIYMPWGFGVSLPGPADTMSFTLGPIQWLIILLAFVAPKRKFFHWAFIVFLFLVLPISAWFWRLFPVLNFVQFPWRLVLFLALIGSYLAAIAAKFYPKITAVLLAGAAIFTVATVHDQGHFNWPDDFYFHYPFTTTTQLEAMPRWFDVNKNSQLFGRPDKVFSLSGQEVKVDQIVWKTQKHSYQVTVGEADQLFERTAYFPGWAVTVDGQQQEIIKDNQQYPGLIGYSVTAGSHQIVTQFSDSTPARKAGDIASLFSLGLLIVTVIFYERKKINHKN